MPSGLVTAPVPDPLLRTEEVLTLALASPGITRASLARRLGGRRLSALAVVQAALAAGVVREGPAQVPIRSGGTRTVTGIYPALAEDGGVATSAEASGLGGVISDGDGVALRALRLEAGVPVAVLADHLGVSRQQLHRWESGRQVMPAHRDVAAALGAAQQAVLAAVIRTPEVRADVRAVVRAIRQAPGQTRRMIVGGSHRRARALEEALGAQLVHVAPSWRPGASRARVGLFPGREPRQVGGRVLASVMRQARVDAGWSQQALAARLDVPRTTIQRWEERLVYVPAWATGVVSTAVVEARRARRPPERDLASEALQVIRDEPGISRKKLAQRLHYERQDGPVGVAVARLFRGDSAHERHAGRHGHQRGLFPGPAPEEVLAPADLRARREEMGHLQVTVADRVPVAETMYQAWEWGTRTMSLDVQRRLVEVLEELAPTAPRERLREVLLEKVGEGLGTLRRLHLAAKEAGLGGPAAVAAELEVLRARGAVHPGRVVRPSVDRRGRPPQGRQGWLPGPDPAR